MDFTLNESQIGIQKLAREFAENELAKEILVRDETRVFPLDLYGKMGGLFVLYPGSGGNFQGGRFHGNCIFSMHLPVLR